MKKTTKIIIVTLIATMIFLGIGYAAIQNITLKIEGLAEANPDQSSYSVKFTGTPVVSDEKIVVAAITDELNATINVSELKTKGTPVSATYTIKNESVDLSADLSIITQNSNSEYFSITSDLEKTSLKAGESTTVTVTVELKKLLIEEDNTSSTIGIQLKATPVQPGEEGKTTTPVENIEE